MPADNTKDFDVLIIGAGIAGAAVARELSKYNLKTAVLERNADVCFGATKGTHAIVHCGLPGSAHTPLRNRGELKGNLMMEQLCKEIDVPFKRIGKLLVAFNQEQLVELKNLEVKARRNGVIDIELIISNQRLKKMEPNISDEVIAALYTRNTAISSPWALTIGLIENAMNNGVRLFLETEVKSIVLDSTNKFVVQSKNQTFRADYIVNAAGIEADKIARLVGDTNFDMIGTRFQRMVMDKSCSGIVRHLVRSINDDGSVGDFISPTVYGDILVGTTVEEVDDLYMDNTTRQGLEEWVIPNYKRIIPALDQSNCIRPFAAVLPEAGGKNTSFDYYIKPALTQPRFINMVLGASGFTASPAIAEYVVSELLPDAGLKLVEKHDFIPNRSDIPHINEMSNSERAEVINKNSLYGRVICRCETVSKGEVVEAIKRGATTLDGIKFRTRAGMGRCQGGFCSSRVAKIISEELGIPLEQVTKKGSCSYYVSCPTKEFTVKEGEIHE
ncbi:MAG: NAD(P)/FAD-dependent oxidoreductase [Tepidanaerobacteraceae bacterium]